MEMVLLGSWETVLLESWEMVGNVEGPVGSVYHLLGASVGCDLAGEHLPTSVVNLCSWSTNVTYREPGGRFFFLGRR